MKTKIKYLLVCLLIASSILTTQDALAKEPKIKIVRRGSDDGVHYNTVIEEHDRNRGQNTHFLRCSGSGSIFCGWTNPPRETDNFGNEVEVDAIMIAVDRLIAGGKLSGRMNWRRTSVLVCWKANDKEVVVDIYPKGLFAR